LEESFKLYDIIISEKFKDARYKLYSLEKEILELLGT
jgi:thiamine-phosphate pyrophosphorylase